MNELDLINKRIEELEPYHQEWLDLLRKRGTLLKKNSQQEYEYLLALACTRAWFIPPEFPEIGSVAVNGSAILYAPDQAQELCKLLSKRTYYYCYTVEWEGPGKYDCIPEWQTDHDNDVTYTGIFKKAKT